jgi:hypothetical protein
VTTPIEKFKDSPRRNQGIILTIAGVVLCLFGFLFSAENWRTSRSFMYNVGQAEIEILAGHRVLVKERNPNELLSFDEYEARGRLAIPLKYVLIVGVLISAVGIGLLTIQPQK